MRIRIYTDGACSDNPGPGGWAVVFNKEDECETLSGNESKTTNNRMELMAVVKSLGSILERENHCIRNYNSYELYSDSAYVVNGINNKWIEKWEMNHWKTAKGDDVKNKDLWCDLINYKRCIDDKGIILKVIKVKGHNGNTFNEYVDKIAKDEVLKVKANMEA